MYKKWALAMLAVWISAWCVQGKQNLDREDLLAAFKQYHPSSLEKATEDKTYGRILYELAQSYTAPNTEENQAELIALVKNFDNSLLLYALQQIYFEKRTLQRVSGTTMEALDAAMLQHLEPIVKSIYQNTLEVRKIQLAHYKQELKTLKKSTSLTAEQKQEQLSARKKQIQQVKKELRDLKTNAKQKLTETAKLYLIQMQAEYDKAQAEQLQAAQSNSHDVKANHKKPVAK